MIIRLIKNNYLLVLILVLGGFLRFLGNYPGYPDNHPDEGISFTTGVYMLFHWMKPDRFDYPAGVSLIQTIFYVILFVPIALFKLFFTQPDLLTPFFAKGFDFFKQYHKEIFGLRDIYAMFWSRYVAALAGVGCIGIVYLISKKLFNKNAGLFAAFFLAVNFRHVLGSHFGLPDIYNGLFSLLSFYASLFLLEKQTRRRYMYVGVSMGAAAAMKYQIFAFFPFFLVCFILFFKKKITVFFNKDFIFALVLSVVVFLLMNPYLLSNLKEFNYQADLTYRWYHMGHYALRLYPYFYLFHWGIGELPFLGIVLGMLFMLKRNLVKALLLLFFVLPFFFILTIYSGGGLYPRNFVTVIPFLMIFAGYFAGVMFKYLRKMSFGSLAVIILIILMNISSMKNSFISSYYYSKPWNSDILMNWMDTNLPSNIILRNHNLIMAFKNRDQYFSIIEKKHIDQLDWNYSKGLNSLAEFQEGNIDFVILNDNIVQNVTYWWRGWDADKLVKYSNIPFEYIKNGFYGLSTIELMNYTVYEIYKPWQAITSGNYLVFKIPKKITDVGKKINEFHFDSKKEMWSLRGVFNLKPMSFGYSSNVGKINNGSILINGGGVLHGNTSRIGSPPIPVQPGENYTVDGWIKNSPKNPDIKRDGFLRIDFYKDKDTLDTLGITVAISARALVSQEWVKEEASAKAPPDARYMTISFQREVQTRDFVSFLDDVEVFETESQAPEPFKGLPYIKSTIPLESLYYNEFL